MNMEPLVVVISLASHASAATSSINVTLGTTVRVLDVNVAAYPSIPAALRAVIAAEPHLVVIDADVPVAQALDIASGIDAQRADTVVIAIGRFNDTSFRDLLRAGVREVVDPDRLHQEIGAAVRVSVERAARLRAVRSSGNERRATTTVIISPKGGSGKTSVVSNIAAALALQKRGSVVLVDFDTLFGDVASAYGMQPERHLGQLIHASLDATTVKVYLTQDSASGVYVLAAPANPNDGEQISEELAARLLELLAAEFDHVIVDTAAGMDVRALAAIDRATNLLLLANTDLTSVKNLRKAVTILDELDVNGPTRLLVINRADQKGGLKPADIEDVFGLRSHVRVPFSADLAMGMNQGVPVVVANRGCDVSRQFFALADAIAGEPAPAMASDTEREDGPEDRPLRRLFARGR
jgi:pilus assembly protein CpaE